MELCGVNWIVVLLCTSRLAYIETEMKKKKGVQEDSGRGKVLDPFSQLYQIPDHLQVRFPFSFSLGRKLSGNIRLGAYSQCPVGLVCFFSLSLFLQGSGEEN